MRSGLLLYVRSACQIHLTIKILLFSKPLSLLIRIQFAFIPVQYLNPPIEVYLF